MKLGKAVTLIRGNTYKSSLLSETEGPVLLGLGSIEKDGGFKRGSWKHYPGESSSDILLHPGDLYVSLKDLTQSCNLLGAVSRVPVDIKEGRLTQDTVRLKFSPSIDTIDKLYIYWSLRTPQYRAYCKARGTGTTNMSLSRADFLDWEIPDKTEMKTNLVILLEGIEAKIELNNQVNDYLAAFADALFDNALKDTNDWTRATLLDIANYKNGLAMQKFRPEGDDPGLPVLKIKELSQGACEADAERCRSDIDESVRIHDGDLVFSWSGTLLLDFWTGGDAGLNQHLFKVTSDKYPSWFFYMWTKYYMRKFIALAKDRATTMGHIKRSALGEARVLIPPNGTLDKLSDQMQPVIDQMIGLKVETRKLGELRDALLPKLMSGEIDVSSVDVTQLNNHLAEKCLLIALSKQFIMRASSLHQGNSIKGSPDQKPIPSIADMTL